MKKFLGHILLFFFPILISAICVAFFYAQVKDSGEFYDVDVCIKYQRENESSLMGMGYYENTPYYKLKNVNYYKPELIALGTSRVMQFKRNFFRSNFYNCGGGVSGNYNEYLNFLLNMEYKPKCMILGIDAWVFNDAWNKGVHNYIGKSEISVRMLNKKNVLKKMFLDWKAGKWVFEDLSNYPLNLGFNGKIKNDGFMIDGSYYYGDIYRNPEAQADYNFANTMERIRTGSMRFEWGDEIDEDTEGQLENLLSYCKDNDIFVVGFSAPFAPAVYDEMINSGKYGYLRKITPVCEALFHKYGFEYYDFLDVRQLGITNACFIDGFHGSEVVYGKLVLQMVSENSCLEDYADVGRIKELLEQSYSGMVFEKPE